MPRGVELALRVLDGRVGRVVGRGDGVETLGQLFQAVAVAVPDFEFFLEALEERRRFGKVEMAAAIFAARTGSDLAAEPLAEKLHAVANAENGKAGIEDAFVGLRSALGVDAGRSAREDDAGGAQAFQDAGGRVVADDFRVDVELPHAARDDLGVLRTEIEDEYLAGHGGGDFFDEINGIFWN